MSIRRDYILRMVEMIGELVAGILGLIKKGDYSKAEQQLKNAYLEYLREDAGFFNQIPAEQLTDELLEKHNYSNDHLLILSNLFFVEGELMLARKNEVEAKNYYKKAKVLLEFVVSQSGSFSLEHDKRLNLLAERLK